jgi:hypothetical protein
MALLTNVFLLTFWGDDRIDNVFSSQEAAVDFAVQEVKHFGGLAEDEEVVVLLDSTSISAYADPNTVLAVIIDPDESERIYTVHQQELNPTFNPS